MPPPWVRVVATLNISLDGAGNPQVANLALGHSLTGDDAGHVIDDLLGGPGRQGRGWERVEVSRQGIADAGHDAGREAGVQGDHPMRRDASTILGSRWYSKTMTGSTQRTAGMSQQPGWNGSRAMSKWR